MQRLWMECPNCKQKVDFQKEMYGIFDFETGEAEFDVESGVYFHTISCDNCKADWIISISPMQLDR